MSDKRCSVPNCNVTRYDGKVILHVFPNPETDTERFNSWLYNIGGDVLALNNRFIFKNRRVCHKHFEAKYYTWTKGLTRNSVPTLHLSDKILPKNNAPSGQELSKPTHDSQESIAAKEVIISGQVQSDNAVHIPQGCIGSENHSTVGQSQNNTVLQGHFSSEKDTLSQESIIPDTFSWNAQSTSVEVPQNEPEHLDDDDIPDNLSMYCDDGDTDTVTPSYVNGTKQHEGFHCDNCKGEIVGFRYTCVQCNNLDLCDACESNSAHAHHYMLRVPSPRPYNEIQTILVRIRRHLMRELDPISAPDRDNEDAISVKSDIKSENEEELEQVDPLYESILYDDEFKENSRLLSPGSEHPENKISEETSQNNKPVLRQVKILKVKRHINQIPLLTVSKNSESTAPPSTAKRKIILSLAEFLKLKESNYIAKKICLMPNKKTDEMSAGLTTSTLKTPKRDVFNPIVKLTKLSPGTAEQEQIGKKLHVMLNTGTKETYIVTKMLTPKATGAFNPVVKLSKLPQSTLLQHERTGPKKALMNVKTTSGSEYIPVIEKKETRSELI